MDLQVKSTLFYSKILHSAKQQVSKSKANLVARMEWLWTGDAHSSLQLGAASYSRKSLSVIATNVGFQDNVRSTSSDSVNFIRKITGNVNTTCTIHTTSHKNTDIQNCQHSLDGDYCYHYFSFFEIHSPISRVTPQYWCKNESEAQKTR